MAGTRRRRIGCHKLFRGAEQSGLERAPIGKLVDIDDVGRTTAFYQGFDLT